MAGEILIVDDEAALVRSLRSTLEMEGYGVLAAGTAAEGLALLGECDLALLDVRLPDANGIEVLAEIRKRADQLPIIMMSAHATIADAVRATQLGAHDFLPKPFTAQALIDAVQAASRFHHAQAGRDAQVAQARAVVAKLSPRERQVFLAVVDGKANKVIAFDLGLSEKTIEEHRKRVMTKLGASSVADLVKLAVLSGLCDPASVATHTEH